MEELSNVATAGGKKNLDSIPPILAIVAAILLCMSFFLPFTTAKEDSIVGNAFAQSQEIKEGSGVTVGELANPSLVTWARVYKAYCESLDGTVTNTLSDYSIMFWMIVIAGSAAVLSLLFALLRKASPTTLFALACLGLVSFICHYFEEYGPVSSGAASVWSFGRVVTLGSAAVLAAAGIWFFIVKHGKKKAAKAA